MRARTFDLRPGAEDDEVDADGNSQARSSSAHGDGYACDASTEDCGRGAGQVCAERGGCNMHRRFWSWQAKRSGGKISRSWADPAEQGSKQAGTQTVLPPFCDPATIEEGVDEAAMKWGPPREHASAGHANPQVAPAIADFAATRRYWNIKAQRITVRISATLVPSSHA